MCKPVQLLTDRLVYGLLGLGGTLAGSAADCFIFESVKIFVLLAM